MQKIGSAGELKELVDANATVVLEFGAPWCGPCRILEPVLHELDGEMGEVSFAKADTDEQPELAAEYQIMSVPVIVIFRNGEMVGQEVGAQPKAKLRATIEAHLN